MRWPAVAALGGALAVAGCAPRERPVPPPRPAPESLPSANLLLESLATRREALTGIRALARTTYSSPAQSRRLRQVLVAARPDRLRLEVLSPFGTVFVLAASRGMLAAYDPGEHKVYRGRASPENLFEYAQVDLPIESAIDVLLSTPPMLPGRRGAVSDDGSRVQLWQQEGNDVRVLWFDSALNPLLYERRNTGGHVLFRSRYDEYERRNGIAVPIRVDLELPPSGSHIALELRDLEVNPPLTAAAFALETPEGSTEIALDPVAW